MIEQFQQWYSNLDGFGTFLWYVTFPSGAMFAIQMILTVVGAEFEGDTDFEVDTETEIDSDADSHAFTRYFSIRNLVSFCLMFGLTGFGFRDLGWSEVATTAASSGCGAVFVIVTNLFLAALHKLSEDGTVTLKSAEGRTGTATTTFYKGQTGEVNLNMGSTTRPYRAVSDKKIRRGTMVEVIEVVDASTVRVQPI